MSVQVCELEDSDHEVNKIGYGGGSIEVIGSHRSRRTLEIRLNDRFFHFDLEETNENLELELAAVLSRIGVYKSSADVTTTASADIASDGSSQLVDDVRCE